jgi:hypothetical protein
MTAAEIAETLQMPLSTVSVVLRRNGVGKLGRIGLEPAIFERIQGQIPELERSLRSLGLERSLR